MSKAQDYFKRRNDEEAEWNGMGGNPSSNGQGDSKDIEEHDTFNETTDGPQDTTDN